MFRRVTSPPRPVCPLITWRDWVFWLFEALPHILSLQRFAQVLTAGVCHCCGQSPEVQTTRLTQPFSTMGIQLSRRLGGSWWCWPELGGTRPHASYEVFLEPVRSWSHQLQHTRPPRTGLSDPGRPLAPPLALPAPSVVPVTGERSQLVVGKGILQVAVVGVVEHGLDSRPGAGYEK